jgi:hypothetical protein
MPVQRYKIIPESALTDPEVIAVLGRASQNALRSKLPISNTLSHSQPNDPSSLAASVLDARTIYPSSLLKDPRLLELWGNPKSIYKDPKTKRLRNIDPLRIFPESILSDPKALEVLAEAARNAIKGIRQAKMPVHSDPIKPSSPTSTASPTAVSTSIPAIQVEDDEGATSSIPKSVSSTPKANISSSTSFSILDQGFSPFLPVSPKDKRIREEHFDALFPFVQHRYKTKGRALIPKLLKVVDYSREPDKALAILNYILLDDGKGQPPVWMRKYLYNLLKMKLSPMVFPMSKREFFTEQYYKDFKEVSIIDTPQSGKKPAHRLTSKSLGRVSRRGRRGVLIEDIFV